jgi:MOSC domain-containing protein YiiM
MNVIAVSIGKIAPLFGATGDDLATVVSGIRKSAVSTLAEPTRIDVGPLGLVGDEQADLTVHGGRDKAVYAFPIEHYPVWQTMRAQATTIDEPLPPGFMGENLTVEGLLENRVWTRRRPSGCGSIHRASRASSSMRGWASSTRRR